uniref:dihydropteroate synthase n=1 Tax=Citrobacter freundii TaxID=546 RepID=UPI0028803FB8|nr:dihydropteroate synthase [Citrobacter freundii]
MVTVFGILNLTEDSFFDESRRLDPAGAVTAAIEMLRVGSDVVDVGPAASHPDARPVSPADEIRRLKSALGLPLLVSVSRKSFLGATVGLPVKDLGPASLAAELHAIGNGADYVRTHAPGDLRSAITFSETLAKFRSRDARDRGLDHA